MLPALQLGAESPPCVPVKTSFWRNLAASTQCPACFRTLAVPTSSQKEEHSMIEHVVRRWLTDHVSRRTVRGTSQARIRWMSNDTDSSAALLCLPRGLAGGSNSPLPECHGNRTTDPSSFAYPDHDKLRINQILDDTTSPCSCFGRRPPTARRGGQNRAKWPKASHREMRSRSAVLMLLYSTSVLSRSRSL